jgi:hypothetical protein
MLLHPNIAMPESIPTQMHSLEDNVRRNVFTDGKLFDRQAA